VTHSTNRGNGQSLGPLIRGAQQTPEVRVEAVDQIMGRIAGNEGSHGDSLSPPHRLRRLAAAAAIAASIALLAFMASMNRPHGTSEVRFDIVAPDARYVSLVGDFNDWDEEATPLRPNDGDSWVVNVRLPAGHYTYAFLVDGNRWIPDDSEARAPASEFGPSNSVIVIPPAGEGP